MVDIRNAVRVRLRSAADLALVPLRRGHREVQMVPDHGVGFGNQAYLWLEAYTRQASGDDYRVLAPPHTSAWIRLFPDVGQALCLTRDELRFLDQRTPWIWRWRDRFGVDFAASELDSFIRHFFLPHVGPASADPHSLVVNVRRGDYYSVPVFRGRYSFDFLEYLRVALARAVRDEGEISRITVVSDDPHWCALKLDHELNRWTPRVDYSDSKESAQDNLLTVCRSRRIIASNSTFSYWAGYISTVLHNGQSQVIAPWFHARLPQGQQALQVDPYWTIIEDIPGGWDG